MTSQDTSVAFAGAPAWRRLLGQSWAGIAVLVIFYLCLVLGFSLLSPFFLTFRNMLDIGSNMAFIGLMAAVGTPLIIAGGLDLSVAAVAGLSGVVVALLYANGINIWAAVLAALLIGGAIGWINGFVSTKLGLNPFIVTLATMSMVSGIAKVMTSGRTRPLLDDSFNWVGSGRLFGTIPVPLILMVLVFILLWLVLRFTEFGRYVFASGGNAEASRMIGVPVELTLVKLYVASGVGGALAGVVLGAMLGAAGPDAAGAHLLTVIAAIILGGTSLYGGRGSVWGTILAVLILGTLNNGLTILDVSSFWQDVTRGAVLLAAVGLDQIRTRAVVE